MGANQGVIEFCNCEEILDNPHIFKCKNLNVNTNNYDIKYILNGYIEEQKEHLTIWRRNMKYRSNTQDPVTPLLSH